VIVIAHVGGVPLKEMLPSVTGELTRGSNVTTRNAVNRWLCDQRLGVALLAVPPLLVLVEATAVD
jgi:hypothetical protein